jgi:hypothetical protein
MFPKTGNVLPNAGGEARPGLSYRETISTALRSELGVTHRAVKQAMRWTGASERTAKNWIAGSHGPSGEHLISPMRHSDEVLASLLAMAGRGDAIVVVRLIEMRGKLGQICELIDSVLEGEDDQDP